MLAVLLQTRQARGQTADGAPASSQHAATAAPAASCFDSRVRPRYEPVPALSSPVMAVRSCICAMLILPSASALDRIQTKQTGLMVCCPIC